MDPTVLEHISLALARIPSGVFLLTARHEDRRMGVLVQWVQRAGLEPPMVSVAVAKGRAILPLISESRYFGLCELSPEDRTLLRRFASLPEAGEDPFIGMDLLPGTTRHLPIPAMVRGYLECEVVCHMDVEGDHDLFVGRVLRGGVRGLGQAVPVQDTRGNT